MKSSGLSLRQVVSSVLAAGFGVQSAENRQRDFEQGRALQFVIVGVVFTALFVGSLLLLVNVVAGM